MTKTCRTTQDIFCAPTARDPKARGPRARAMQLAALAHVLMRARDTNMNMDPEFGLLECHELMFQLADELTQQLEEHMGEEI